MMSETFQLCFLGSVLFGMGTCLYFFQLEKEKVRKEIENIKHENICEITQLQNLKRSFFKYRFTNPNERRFFLIKTKGQNIYPEMNSLQNQIKIYSNQLYFCPPSVEPIFDKQIKKHRSIFKLDRLRIFTDKFQCKTEFKPRQMPQLSQHNPSSTLSQIKLFAQIGGQIFYHIRKSFWYFAQKSLEFFKIKKDQKRSYDKHRSPFFKGVLAGILDVNFNLLKDSYYVLKVNVQGSHLYCDIVADNKLALIHLSEKIIRLFTIIQIISLPFFLFGAYEFGKRIKHKVRKIWFNLTTFDKKILNSSKISDDKLCQICYVNCRNVLFYGCKHFIVCDDCYQHLGKVNCIICNQVLQKAQPLYMVSN